MTRSAFKYISASLLVLLLAGCQSNSPRDPYAEPYYYPPQSGGGYPLGGYPGGGYGYYAVDPDGRASIHGRVDQAQQSIEHGQRQGSLTQKEAQGLRRELDGITQRLDQMKGDGHLSSRERERIGTELDRLQRNIRREKHDDERRAR